MRRYKHGVGWMNPYTQPPHNLPRIILSVDSPYHRPPEKLKRKINRILDRLHDRDINGYCSTWTFYETISRKWSEEAKQRNRLRRLKARLQKQFSIPELFQAELDKAISHKPEYYGL